MHTQKHKKRIYTQFVLEGFVFGSVLHFPIKKGVQWPAGLKVLVTLMRYWTRIQGIAHGWCLLSTAPGVSSQPRLIEIGVYKVKLFLILLQSLRLVEAVPCSKVTYKTTWTWEMVRPIFPWSAWYQTHHVIIPYDIEAFAHIYPSLQLKFSGAYGRGPTLVTLYRTGKYELFEDSPTT